MDHSQYGSRIVYPQMPEPLTERDLACVFTVSPQEDHWARTVARKGPWLAVLLTQLKVFQHVGRFLPTAELPAAGMSHVIAQAGLEMPADFGYDRRTLYRQHHAIREFLGITPWGAKARAIASGAIAAAAEARVDPADLINAAIDALIRERCELPMLSTLRELAATAHRLVNAAQWDQVHDRLSEAVRRENLPPEASDPQRIAAYAVERGWPAGAVGFTAHLRDKLDNEARRLDTDVGLRGTVQLDKNRRPIVPRIIASELPVSVAHAVRQVLEEMPERSVLEALANTAQWAHWPRHFGLPSRLGSGIENLHER